MVEKPENSQKQTGSRNIYCFFKRFVDIVLALIGIIVLFFPMALIALVIYIDDPGPPFFVHERVGKNNKPFLLYKLRTMRVNTPKYLATKDVDDPYNCITRIGKVLRKISVDELPQLINILKGDMSFVGPRPLISQETEIHQMRSSRGVYSVRPGLTGLAQINGRDMISPEEKVNWDVIYIENLSLKTDLKILLATIPKVFGSDGVAEGLDSTRKK